MISISPFKFENNKLILEPILLTYRQFKDVYNLDNSSKKDIALQYFIYIYHSADVRAIPVLKGYSKKETHEYASNQAGFTDTFKPDNKIHLAITFYKENFISPVKQLQISLLNMLENNSDITEKINALVTTKLEENIISNDTLSNIISLQKDINTMIKELPNQIKILKEIDIMLLEENKGSLVRRGGGIITSSMTRNSEIENDD
jgi:hypothetical protein